MTILENLHYVTKAFPMRITNRSTKTIYVKFDTDRAYLTESLDKASEEAGFNVSGGAKGAEGAVGANWNSSTERQRKYINVLASRGFTRLPPGT